jgi:hypothetical protein
VAFIEPGRRTKEYLTIGNDNVRFATVEADGRVIWDSRPLVPCDMALWQTSREKMKGGGVGTASPRPFLHTRLWCDHLPAGSDFPHSCRHGEGPHEILVCLTKKDNEPAVYARCAAPAR